MMDIVAGGAGDAFFGVGGKLPGEILLMVPFGEIFCVSIFKVSVIVTCGLEVESQCPAGLITHRPFSTLYLGRRAAGVAGSADLGSESRRKTGRVDDGQPFVKNRRFGQGHIVGTGSVAGLAADTRFRERVLVQIDTHGMTTGAVLGPGALVPLIFIIVNPVIGLGIVLNGRHI